jgi:signal transduction histidine kinase
MRRYKRKTQGLDFRFSISNDVPKLVEGDENRLVQILNNVLSNAIKFTAGNVNFVISLLVKKESKVSFIMKVSDSGWESQRKIDTIFDSFLKTISTIKENLEDLD